MKRFLSLIFLFAFAFVLRATHNRAGEITYRWKSGKTYEVTITTYSKESAPADRCSLQINWGDQTSSILPRSNGPLGSLCPNGERIGESIGNDVKMNIYKGEHTYETTGNYILSFEDMNRNSGVNNIQQSVNKAFYVQSELVISAGLAGNSSPVLKNYPIDDGCLNERFEHNPGAVDIDGDRLVYSLVMTREAGGIIIPTTYDPAYVQDKITIDSVSGDLIWDLPKNIGQFNFAIEIAEYRKNGNGFWQKIGYVTRDLQVTINNCNNHPPEIQPVGPFCVEAGQNLNFDVTATDVDDDHITFEAFGAPFEIAPVADPFGATGKGSVTATFNWNTACSHVRMEPYFVTFEANDNPAWRSPLETPLVDVYTTEIRVVAPSPKNPIAVGGEKGISLNWDASFCTEAIGYKIYRRNGSYGFVPSECETGVPAYTGYQLIDTTLGLNSTSYIDSVGLVRGIEYCYMVVASFEDGSESYASVEFCASKLLTAPIITNVDVLTTDPLSGDIAVRWIQPLDLDSFNFPPPYSYKLYRANGISGTDFQEIQAFGSLSDTSYLDTVLNTRDQGYNYKVEFYSGTPPELVSISDPASSVYLDIQPSDESNILNINHHTPWKNSSFVIFREDPVNLGQFDSIDVAYSSPYIDTGLVNGANYCYKILSIGSYTVVNDSIPTPLLNNSQIDCATPLDTNAPCAPVVTVQAHCEGDSLRLQWSLEADSGCVNDIKYYNIYYKSSVSAEFPGTPAYSNITDNFTTIIKESIAGCYAITAVDDAEEDPNGVANESELSNLICISACPFIDFPNVFTPNMDGINDVFIPIRFKDIGELDIQIFNRWGVMVYDSHDINYFFENGWDGTDINTGRLVSDGVYFYFCRYSPVSITKTEQVEVKGFVHLFR